MFETEDGIFDTTSLSRVDLIAFKVKYPNAKEIKQQPEENGDGILSAIESMRASGDYPIVLDEVNYDKYREKGAVRKPEGVEEVTTEVQESYNPYGFGGGYKPKSREVKSKEYTADIEVELEDGSKIYLTANEVNDPDINPTLNSKESEIKNKYYLENGDVDRSIFEPKKVVDSIKTTYNPYGYGGAGRTTVKEILPYEEDIKDTMSILKELGKGSDKIPEKYRDWEGENPPIELVQDYVADLKYRQEIAKARKEEYDKAVSSFTKGEQEATRLQVQKRKERAETFLDKPEIKDLDIRLESYQNDPRYIQNLKIAKKFENGETLTQGEIKQYQNNAVELNEIDSKIHEDYEKYSLAIEEVSDSAEELDLLKRDYSLLNKFGFNAASTLSGLSFGLLEYLAPLSGIPGSNEIMEQMSIKRRKELEEAREKYRPDVAFEDAFSSLDNFGRFITEETGRQLPIFALIAASGGAATALGATSLGAGAVSGVTLGTMSAGQQIGDMTYEEFLSKYNDVKAYGKNLEYNDKEYSDLNKFLVGTGFGAAEGLLGAAPTFILGSRFFNNATKSFIKAGEKGLLAKIPTTTFQKALNFGKPFAKEFVIGSAEEAITEGLTTLTQNIITRNSNIFEGVGHAAFSGGFFGGALGGGSVAMGSALSMSMNTAERAQIQDLLNQKQGILKQLSSLDGRTKGALALKNRAENIEKEISDKMLTAEKTWLSKMSKPNFEAYTKTLDAQARLRQQAFDIKNDETLSKAEKKKEIDLLAIDYQGLQGQIEAFRNPLDYANKYHLLKTTDEARYNEINKEASSKLSSEGVDLTKEKIDKEAYEVYLNQELESSKKSANKALKNLKLKHNKFNFKTEKDAIAEANKILKQENLDDLTKSFWKDVIDNPGRINGQAANINGTYTYITIDETALKNERSGTATHEVGHIVFWDLLRRAREEGGKSDIALDFDSMAKDIEKYLKATHPEIHAEMFSKRDITQRVEEAGGVLDSEEIVMGFVERIGRIDKNKKVTQTFLYRLGQIFNTKGNIPTDLSTQPAIVSFISSLAEKIKDGTLSREQLDVAAKSDIFKSLVVKEKAKSTKDIKAKPETKKSLSILNTINSLVPKDVKTKAEFQGAKIFNPIYEATQQGGAIYNYVNSRALSREEAGLMLEGIVDRLINYDPAAVRKTKSGEPITFGEFIFANTRFSKLDAKKQLAIESERRAESLDTEEARQVAEPVAETTTTEDPRVEYQSLVEANVLPAEMVSKVKDKILLITKTLKSRIDAATSINKTVTPLMSEIKKEIGKQADIEFKKMLGAKRGGELRNNFLKLKKPILENMTTTWLMQGMPFAIQKSVDGKFTSDWEGKKIDRESVGTDQAGRTAGAQLARRLPNAANKITDEQFLTYMFKGDEVIRGRKEALAKALAEEYAFDVYSKELQDTDSEIRKAFEDNQERLGVQLADNTIQEFNKQAERGNVKRSISNLTDKQLSVWNSNAPEFYAGLKTIIPGNFTLKSISALHKQIYSTEDIPAELQKSISKQFFNVLKSIKSEEQLRQLEIQEGSFESYLEAIAKDMDANETITAMTNAPQSVPASYSDFNNVLEAREAIEDVIKNIDIQEAVAFMGGTFANSGRVGRWVEGKYYANITHRSDLYAGQGEVIKALNRAGFNIKSISNKDITLNNGKVIKRELSATGNVNKSHITGKHDLEADKKNADAAWNFTTAIIKGIKNATPTVQQMVMASLNSGTNTSLRAAAPVLYVSNVLTSKLTKDYRYEHGVPARVVLAHMYSSIVKGNKDIDMNALKQDYSVAIIPVEMDKVIGESGYQKVMFAGYVPGKRPWYSRYYNFATRGKIQYALKSFEDGSIIGQKYADYYNNAKKRSLSNFNVDESNKVKNQQKALNNARKRSYSENPKGISVYDFDDTLAFSKSQIIVKKDGKTFKINAAQFAKQGETLLAEGAEFDFSEFNKVVKGQPGPLIPRIQKAIDKFGNKNIFILTARPVASESAIHAFMKGLGIEIPRANITGLANSTAQAKADWMVGKVAEGFNDFYFVDDAIKNVQAVRDVLETFDVNSKVQQAIAQRKRSMSSDLNKMIERNKGVRAETTYSKVLARKKGAQKGKFKFFVPYSAEDFKGLTSYTLAGKGKQGEADQRFFDQNLILPYTRGIAAMEGATQALKNDYKNLLGMFGLKKQLPRKIGDTDFTTDQAVRVYLWDKQGFEIPNISQRDQNKLSKLVAKDPDLVGFAEGLMAVSKKDQWVNPKDHWDVGSILKDLNDITDNVNRKEYLAEFIENVDEMFDKTTLNKLEAIYGTNYVDALQDSIRRMKSGSNTPRSAGKIERKWLNWVNNSVGTIMFFNRRSALLQMLSFTNFINWSDNNPAMAAAAFANQPLYWKKWAEIFNSDKLKERRGGLKSDIQESEIANQAKNSKDKAAAVVSYLLKIGFTPTQIADSFAIATGGATFLINRTKKYEKQGLSKKEAEAKAFEDFGRISDETQQSGDPMLISQQQSSHLGRLILAFQNTPMQYTRLMKKAGKDIINRRGSDVENLSKIAYYGFVQNLIFSSLQSALFALIPGFDDEEEDDAKLEDKAIRTANSMVDTILRGSGLAGAVVSTLKNAIMRYQKEDKKAQERYGQGDQTYTMLELANISPPIGSKLRKIYSAIQTKKFNQAAIEEMGYDLTIDGKLNPSPNYEIIANISSAVGNLPLDRLLSEVKSITEAFDSRNTSYQRLALALGWRTWDVNVRNEEQDLIKAESKKRKTKASKQKAKDKRELKKFEKEREQKRKSLVEEIRKMRKAN